MTITVNLPAATVEKLQAQAGASGKDIETFVREAVEAKLALSGLSFREILEPIHREVEASGISEAELDDVVDREVAALRAERKASRTPP
jgi:hypothetical protein